MGILNYTTRVPISKTVTEIQKILTDHGAKSVRLDYEGGQAVALAFLVGTEFGDQSFRLPINEAGVWAVMVRQYERGTLRLTRSQVTRAQSARVAWRIVKDWLAAQMALIEAGQASLDQVMLPYLQLEGGRTLYETVRDGRYALPAAREA